MRALSAMEAGIWRTDRAAPLNFTTVARISGPLTDDAVRAALPAVRARHAFLRARIAVDERGTPVFVEDAGPLTLTVVDGDWVQELDREINEPFDPKAPLARFVRVGDRLLVTIHHSVGDGMSGVFLMRDLIAAAAQALEGKTPALPPLDLAASVDDGLPAWTRSLRAWANHLRFAWAALWAAIRAGLPVKVRRDQQRFAHSRKARVMPHVLDASFAETLTARARLEQTTVHGALSAAIILGILADAKRARGNITFGTPMNLRAQLAPVVGEQLGFYVSILMLNEVIRADTPFWEVARLVRRRLEGAIARGAQLSILRLLPRVFGLVAGTEDRRKLLERFERAAPSTSGLTNLGRLTVETQHGPLRIEDCHFAACPSALGDFLATATSLHGRMFWNFVWPDPVLTEAHAAELVGGIVARLRSAVEQG